MGNFFMSNDGVETLTDDQYFDAIKRAVMSFESDKKINVSPPEVFHSNLIWPDNRDAYLEGIENGKSDQQQSGLGVRRWSRGDLDQLARQAIALRNEKIGGEPGFSRRTGASQ